MNAFTDSRHLMELMLRRCPCLCYQQKHHSMKNVRELRRPIQSQRLMERRRRVLAFGAMLALGAAGALALLFVGCGGGSGTVSTPIPPASSVQPLQIADVQK